MAAGIDAMRKTVREKEPMRPSTRLATLGANELTTTTKRRSADTAKLLHQLKGDLDWIVMKCLEQDRTRHLRDGQWAGRWGKAVEAAEWKQKMAEFEQAAKAAEKKALQP